MHHAIRHGMTTKVSGLAPDPQRFLGMRRRLTPDAGWGPCINQSFHFICDRRLRLVLVLWLCRGRIWQNIVEPHEAEALFDTLNRVGFKAQRID